MNSVSFAIGMVNKVSGPARAASGSVTKLTADLSHLNRQLSLAKNIGDIDGYRRYSAAVDRARRSLYEANKEAGLSPLSLTGAGAAVAGVTAIAAAWGAVTEKILSAANAQQTFQRQTRAAFVSLGGDQGEATYKQFELVSKWIPVAREQLATWTKELQASGIKDPGVLRKGLLALSGSSALVGSEGAETLLGTIRRVQEAIDTNHGLKLADRQLAGLAKTGANVNDVAKELGISTEQLQQKLKAGTQNAAQFGDALLTAVEKKGRAPLKAMWLDLDVLKKKGEELASGLFKNVDLSPASDAIQRFLSLLDQSTAAGDDLGKGVTKGTNMIVRGFADIVDGATIAYLKIATFALNVDTALMPIEKTIGRINVALRNITGSGIGGHILGALSLGAYDPGAPTSTIKSPATISAADRLRQAAGAVARARVVGGVTGSELQAMGDQLSDSLAAGIKQGLITKEEGVKLQGIALGKAAVEGVKKGTDSHSPSRATFRVGGFVGAGLSLGMRSSASDVRRASVYLGEQATRSSLFARAMNERRSVATQTASAGMGGGVTIGHVENNIVAPHGVTDATDISAYGLAVSLERQQLMGGG